MKRIMTLVAVALMVLTAWAQGSDDAAAREQQRVEVHARIFKAEPTKEVKKQAKKLRKEGWSELPGELPLEVQLNRSILYSEELMAGEKGILKQRFIQQSGVATSGSRNMAGTMAHELALGQMAARLDASVETAIDISGENEQKDAVTAFTSEKLKQHVKSAAKRRLNGSSPVLTMYRRLENNNFEVETRIILDKEELIEEVEKEAPKNDAPLMTAISRLKMAGL